ESDEAAFAFLADRPGPLGFRRVVEISALHAQLSGNPAFARSFARTASVFAQTPLVRLLPVEDIGIEHGRLYRVTAVHAAFRLPQWLGRIESQGVALSAAA